MFIIFTRLCASTAVSRNTEDRRRVRRVDEGHQRGEKHLGVGSVTSGVRNPGRSSSGFTIVEFCSREFPERRAAKRKIVSYQHAFIRFTYTTGGGNMAKHI